MSIHLTSRRGFLRGLGAAVSLPALEAFHSPLKAASTIARPLATTASGAPLRMAYLYVPNGVNLDHWRPKGESTTYEMGQSFNKSMQTHREDFQIFTGFEQKNANPMDDGAGDHARANSVFLTSARPKKTSGSDIRLGISVDQVAANAIAEQTRFASLELSTSRVRKSGKCDSGYSCAYQFNLSWRSETQPMTPESSPRAVFERLFGGGGSAERLKSMKLRNEARKSVLDFIQDDAKALHRHLSRTDRLKLDEYLTGVRELEKRIEKSESHAPVDPGVSAPEEYTSHEEQLKMMFDMMVLAFKTDSTRVSSFMLAHDGSNRSFPEIGINDGHHHLSHHKGKDDKKAKIAQIDEFYLAQLSYFLERMKTTEDVDGNSLLHNSMIVYGSGNSDGNRHNHDDLPILVAGHAGGAFSPGRHVDLGRNVPMANLYLRMLEEFGISERRFGDSSGVLSKI